MGNCLKRGSGDDSDEKVDFSGGNVHLITSKESWDEKISEANKAGKIVVANFSASWCGPCRVITPLYAELSLKYSQFVFLTIDVDDLPDVAVGKAAAEVQGTNISRERVTTGAEIKAIVIVIVRVAVYGS